MKITLDLNEPLRDLDGVSIPEMILGPQLASSLVGQPNGNVVKFYDWAVTLNRKHPIEVDQADFDMLRRFIESSDRITILGKRQMMDLMDKAKAEANTPPTTNG